VLIEHAWSCEKRAVLVEVFMKLKLKVRKGHNLMAIALLRGVSRAMLNEMHQRVMLS
jgi:hypothetical protein